MRELLNDMLVIGSSEFGRTLFDHMMAGIEDLVGVGRKPHSSYFIMFEAGVGGLERKRLTYHYSGRDFRITYNQGKVVRTILSQAARA